TAPDESPRRGDGEASMPESKIVPMRPTAAAIASATGPLTVVDLVTLQRTTGEGFGRDPLVALSQRKLNALGLALGYIDRRLRFRFANKAFLDWLGKRPDEVHGRQAREVLGEEAFARCAEHLETALGGQPAGFECQLAQHGRGR